MKIMNISRLMILLLVVFGQTVNCAIDIPKTVTVDEMSVENQQKFVKAVVETNLVIKNATELMDSARKHLFDPVNEDEKNIKIIIEQNAIIVGAQQKLEKLRDELTPKSYISQLIAGFKNFFGGSDKDKEFDSRIIKSLIEQKEKIADSYAMLTSEEQAELKKRYDAIIELINKNIIYRQNLQNPSMLKRAGAFGLGAAAGGVLGFAAGEKLADKYFAETSVEPPKQPIEEQIMKEVLVETPTETLITPTLQLTEITPGIKTDEIPVIQKTETFVEETPEIEPIQSDITDLEDVEKEEEIVQEEVAQELKKDTKLSEIDKLDALIEREKDAIVQYTRKMREAYLNRDNKAVDLYKDSISTIENYVKDLSQKREALWDAVMVEQRDLASSADEAAQIEQEKTEQEAQAQAATQVERIGREQTENKAARSVKKDIKKIIAEQRAEQNNIEQEDVLQEEE